MPFISEELWHAVWEGNPPRKSIALAIYPAPRATSSEKPPEILEMELLQSLIVEIRALRKEIGVEEKATVPIEVRADAELRKLAEENRDIIEKLARVSEVRFVDAITPGLSKHHAAAFDVAIVFEKKIDMAAERERLTKEIAKLEKALASAEKQLGNPAFLGKAPANVVEGLKRQEMENRLLLEKARIALASLPPE
jgi:valyl-tRNA synthetase